MVENSYASLQILFVVNVFALKKLKSQTVWDKTTIYVCPQSGSGGTHALTHARTRKQMGGFPI